MPPNSIETVSTPSQGMSKLNINGNSIPDFTVKAGLAQMLKGGVIMDVVNVEQARIAEEAGAVAVMALERIPADIRRQGSVARMSDPQMILEIKNAVSIPVMAKVSSIIQKYQKNKNKNVYIWRFNILVLRTIDNFPVTFYIDDLLSILVDRDIRTLICW